MLLTQVSLLYSPRTWSQLLFRWVCGPLCCPMHRWVQCHAQCRVHRQQESPVNSPRKDFVITKSSETFLLSRLTAIDVPAPRGLILQWIGHAQTIIASDAYFSAGFTTEVKTIAASSSLWAVVLASQQFTVDCSATYYVVYSADTRQLGCAGQAADAVSAYTQVTMEDASTSVKIPKSEYQVFGYVYRSTNGPNHGPVWKTQSFLFKGICTVILWQDYYRKGNSGRFYENTVGRKFQIGNVSLFIVKKDYSYLCMWMT